MLHWRAAWDVRHMSEPSTGFISARRACSDNRRRRVSLAALTLGLVAAAACGSSPTQPSPPAPPPAEVAITCPANQSVTLSSGTTYELTFAPETSGGVPPLTTTCEPASGTAFPIGTTKVSCTARDSIGQVNTCSFSVEVIEAHRIKYTRFLAFGDSITAGEIGVLPGMHVVNPAQSYPTVLQQMLQARYTAQTIKVDNAGLSGALAQTDYDRLFGALLTYNPQVVIIAEGTNDINGGEANINPAVDAMYSMVRKIRDFGAIPILGSIPPERYGFPDAFCPECVVPYNNYLFGSVGPYAERTVDIYSVLNANIDMLIGGDGIHPTAEGYQEMATAYYDVIVKLFEEPGTTSGLARYGNHR